MAIVNFGKMLDEKAVESKLASFIVDKRKLDNDPMGLQLRLLLKRVIGDAYTATLLGYDNASGGFPVSIYRHSEVAYDEKTDRRIWGARPMGFESAIEVQIKGPEIGVFVVDPDSNTAISTRMGKHVSMDDFNAARENGIANRSGAENLYRQIFVHKGASVRG